MIALNNGMDIIDMMGPDAKREDYEWLRNVLNQMLADPEMWADEEEAG